MYFVKGILINCPCIRNTLPAESFWWRCLALIKVFQSSKHYQMRWESFFPYLFFLWAGLVLQQPRNSFKDKTRHSESQMSQTLSCHPASPPTEGKVEKSNQILPQQKLMVTGDVSCLPLLFYPSVSSFCVWL